MKLSSYGFSLIELMIGGAILAGIGLTGAQLVKGQRSMQAKIDHDLELDLIHANISAMFLENAKDCDATFRQFYGGAISAPITRIRKCSGTCNPHTDASTVSTSSPVVFTVGAGSELSSRSLWYIESFGNISAHNGLSTARTNAMILPVNYAHKKITNRKVTKYVSIAMRFNLSGHFLQCIDGTSSNIKNAEKELCKAIVSRDTNGHLIRGHWDADRNECRSFVLPSNCAYSSFYPGHAGANETTLGNCQSVRNTFSAGTRDVHGPPVSCRSFVKLSGQTGNKVAIRCL